MAQTVTIASTTSLAAIYYTTDGSTPTFPVSGTTQIYTGPLTVASSLTLTAIAVAPGFATSTIAIAIYTVSGLIYQGATLAGFTPGVPYSQSTSGFVSGGVPPLTFTFVSSTGPDTWVVSATGTISGTPGGVPLVTMTGIPYVTISGSQYTT